MARHRPEFHKRNQATYDPASSSCWTNCWTFCWTSAAQQFLPFTSTAECRKTTVGQPIQWTGELPVVLTTTLPAFITQRTLPTATSMPARGFAVNGNDIGDISGLDRESGQQTKPRSAQYLGYDTPRIPRALPSAIYVPFGRPAQHCARRARWRPGWPLRCMEATGSIPRGASFDWPWRRCLRPGLLRCQCRCLASTGDLIKVAGEIPPRR